MSRRWGDMRFALAMLTVLALLGRAVVPGGYMMQSTADGRVEIVICTEGGTGTLWLDADGSPIDPADEQTSDQSTGDDGSCPFALSAISAMAEISAMAPEFARLPVQLHLSANTDQRVRIAILAINAARAPPSLI
jgi:hypothetical protein